MIKEMIDNFSGKYNFLSNFHPCLVHWDGRDYPSSEAAYQSAKTLVPEIREKFTSLSAYEAKKMGRAITLREDWEEVKVQVMEEIVRAKFTQNENLRESLLKTGEEKLVEGNHWGDTFWGVCEGKGDNHLGKILMGIRTELRRS